MAKLPNPNEQTRPTPRFGGAPAQLPKLDAEARAKTNLGQSMVGFGEALAKAKIKDDKFQVEDATTRLQQRRLELRDGDGGFTTYKSADVAGDKEFNTAHMTKFDDAAKEISDSLGNDEQKAMFAARANLGRVGHNSDLINHVTRERDAFNAQVYKGGIASEIDVAGADYQIKGKVDIALLRTKQLTTAEADRLKLSEDARKMLFKENASNIHETVIRTAIDDGNHMYAKDWYKKNQKHVLGNRQAGIEKLLRASGVRADSQEAADEFVTKYETEGEALAAARKIKDPEVRDATVTRLKARFGEAAQELDASQKAAGEQAWSIFGVDKDINDVPVSLLEDMDGKERVALEGVAAKIASGTKVETDWGAYYGLKEMVANDPVAFKNLNLMGYANHLGNTEMKELIKLQTDDKGITLARSKSQVMKMGADNIGINKKQIKQGFGDDIEKYYQRIDEELRSFQQTTGKEPTTDDIANIVNDLSIEILKDPKAWFFTGGRPAYSAEIDGVPNDMVDELARALVGKTDIDGKPVVISDENILKLYNYSMTHK